MAKLCSVQIKIKREIISLFSNYSNYWGVLLFSCEWDKRYKKTMCKIRCMLCKSLKKYRSINVRLKAQAH